MRRAISPVGRGLARPWLALGAAIILVTAPRAHAADDARQIECDLGVALALGGESARAESVFISLLSHAPGDPRALTNLGNLHLLRGEVGVALSFYDRALVVDSMDAGIVLNEATALLLSGDDEGAVERARLGIRMAGGVLDAASLLGLRYEGSEPVAARGAKKTRLSKEEVLALLREATGRVPTNSTRPATPPSTAVGTKGKKHAPEWRSAGPRAGEAETSASFVYWKRH